MTALALWVVVGAGDYLALAREIGSGRYPDYRGQAVAVLEARGLTALRGEFRLAHVLTFRSQERVIVSALERERIDEYAARAGAGTSVPHDGSMPRQPARGTAGADHPALSRPGDRYT